MRTFIEGEGSCKYSKALLTFSKFRCSILILMTFSGVLISASSFVAPSISPVGHTCSSRRVCALIIWTEGGAWDKTDTSCFPSLIALPGISIFNALVMLLNIADCNRKTVSFCSPLFYSCIRLVVKIFHLQVFLSNLDIYITSHSTKVMVLHLIDLPSFYRKSQYDSTKIRIDPIPSVRHSEEFL